MLEYLYYALFFLIPLIFYPRTSELFEFNKIILLYIFTILIVSSWITRSILKKKVIFRRTTLDIPLLLFLGSQIISTIFSIDTRTSFFGYYSRFNGGLLSLICYALLYWAFVSNFNKENSLKLIKITLISAALVAIYGILEHFGGSISCVLVRGQFNDTCWVQDVKTRVFATLGQPNWLAAYLISVVPLTWYFASKTNVQKQKMIWIGISILLFACILFTRSRSGLLALGVADIVFWVGTLAINFKNKIKFKKLLLIFVSLHLLFALVCLAFGTDITPSIGEFLNKKPIVRSIDTSEGGTESGAIRAVVWKGAINIWRAYPIFGTGVETFGYSYWQFRPIAHNLTSEWDYLYNKAHNEYLNFAANSGSVGLISYLILIAISIYTLRKNHALLAGYISILITNFFGFSVVVISLFTFLFPAIAVAISSEKLAGSIKDKKELELNNNQKLLIGGILLAACFLLFATIRYWQADYLYAMSISETQVGYYNQAVKDLNEAISYSPTEGIFRNQMARIFTNVAVTLAEEKDATSASQLVPYAINESEIAFGLSPRNMNIRETRISIYLELARFDPSYIPLAIDFIKETIPLSPTDPKLHLILGKTYANIGKISDSIKELQIALSLKPDYIDAKSALNTVEKLQTKK